MARNITAPGPKQSGGNRPRFRFVTLWQPSAALIGGLMVGVFAVIGVAALTMSHAATSNDQNRLDELRIMPLGDALTDGQPTYAGAYRALLWQKLVDQDHLKVDYVGSQSNGDNSLPDKDHEGHVGWRIDQLNSQAGTWVTTYRPNVVLLEAGATDLEQGASGQLVAGRLDALLSTVVTADKSVHVLVATAAPLNIGGGWNGQAWQEYNAAVPKLVNKYRTQGYEVSYVDIAGQAGLAQGSPDIADGVHPTVSGYAKIAEVWYAQIKSKFE
jgi:lysophospholipase L1-like esterase